MTQGPGSSEPGHSQRAARRGAPNPNRLIHMPTLTQRFDSLRSRAAARPALDPDAIGEAMLKFAENGVLPTRPAHPRFPNSDYAVLLEVVADAEEALSLILGVDTNGDWLTHLDQARGDVDAFANATRRLARSDGRSILNQLRKSILGTAAIKVASS